MATTQMQNPKTKKARSQKPEEKKQNVDYRAIKSAVKFSLQEDIGKGDISAALIARETQAQAIIITREDAVVCGIPWVDEVFYQVDRKVRLNWHVNDGDKASASDLLVEIRGPARSLVSAERSALNWLQTLSATATQVASFLDSLKNSKVQLLDTRKTIPGLRYAQKYAVRIAGGKNHRMGLFDAYLIKENHIASCESITNAVARARKLRADKPIEIEVETIEQFQEALAAGADIILLDNFTLEQMREAVLINRSRVKIEESGNVEKNQLHEIAQTGIDYISVGALTKHIRAIDLSMRIIRL